MHSNLLVLSSVLSIVAMSLGSCGDFPKDPRDSLANALKRDTLRVGVCNRTGWGTGRIDSDSTASSLGIDATLLQAFADELGVELEFYLDSPERLFRALEQFELDIVAGGITQSNAWTSHVGTTVPYYTSRWLVGVPEGLPPVSDLQGKTVMVPPASGLVSELEGRGATVVVADPGDSLPSDILIADEEWKLAVRHAVPDSDLILRRDQLVMAVPPGENRLLMRLEDFLGRPGTRTMIGKLLSEWRPA